MLAPKSSNLLLSLREEVQAINPISTISKVISKLSLGGVPFFRGGGTNDFSRWTQFVRNEEFAKTSS